MKVCILIPGYNESATIGQVVTESLRIIDNVIVIDDGSDDNTAEIARKAGAVILRHGKNKGKGSALKTGFRYVIENNYDVVITMDGDGQHDPGDINRFLEALENIKSGIIIGSRMGDISAMPAIRKFSNRITSFVGSLMVHQKIDDSQSGFRLITREVLDAITIEANGYEMESEMLIKASKAGFGINSVPIKTIYGQEKSKIKPIRDTYRFLRLFFRSLNW